MIKNEKKAGYLLMLVMAYFALLAHAFVPHHHHHSDFTAHLNGVDCAGHSHSDSPLIPQGDVDSDCLTLNHALIEKHSAVNNSSDEVFNLIPFADIVLSSSTAFGWYLPVIYPDQLEFLYLEALPVSSLSRRGPPSFGSLSA